MQLSLNFEIETQEHLEYRGYQLHVYKEKCQPYWERYQATKYAKKQFFETKDYVDYWFVILYQEKGKFNGHKLGEYWTKEQAIEAAQKYIDNFWNWEPGKKKFRNRPS